MMALSPDHRCDLADLHLITSSIRGGSAGRGLQPEAIPHARSCGWYHVSCPPRLHRRRPSHRRSIAVSSSPDGYGVCRGMF